ncbi:IS110 family transposase [Chitinophaga polysaccharea]|uniref:IS110 family transposase n=1 Tax=Chitinophaga polysaccharea TaxID=1293035 RepID=UPI00115B402E|nr:transposase [Chitinophaga polysaccharea]
MKNLFVGIDISKQWLDVCLVGNNIQNVYLRVDNNKTGFRRMVQWLTSKAAIDEYLICMEHTGIYGQPLWYYLTEKGIEYSVVAGSAISNGLSVKRGKTDKQDALSIARFTRRYADELKPHKLPAQLLQRLKMLLAYRDRLVKAKVLLAVPAREVRSLAIQGGAEVVADTLEVIKLLHTRIKRVEKLMLELINSDPQTEQCFKLVHSVPGLGIITGTYLLVVTECFTLFSKSRQMACYSGGAPLSIVVAAVSKGEPEYRQRLIKSSSLYLVVVSVPYYSTTAIPSNTSSVKRLQENIPTWSETIFAIKYCTPCLQ